MATRIHFRAPQTFSDFIASFYAAVLRHISKHCPPLDWRNSNKYKNASMNLWQYWGLLHRSIIPIHKMQLRMKNILILAIKIVPRSTSCKPFYRSFTDQLKNMNFIFRLPPIFNSQTPPILKSANIVLSCWHFIQQFHPFAKELWRLFNHYAFESTTDWVSVSVSDYSRIQSKCIAFAMNKNSQTQLQVWQNSGDHSWSIL